MPANKKPGSCRGKTNVWDILLFDWGKIIVKKGAKESVV